MKIGEIFLKVMHRYFFGIILGDPEVSANIYCRYATFPIQIHKITVQNCGNFWVTQYVCYAGRAEIRCRVPS